MPSQLDSTFYEYVFKTEIIYEYISITNARPLFGYPVQYGLTENVRVLKLNDDSHVLNNVRV